VLRFLLTRLLRTVLTILLVVTFAFTILRLSGDPAMVILGPNAPAAALEAFRKAWGLDRPLWAQYAAYVRSIVSGDFGLSLRDGTPALALVLERIPATLQRTVPALLLQLLVGIPAGIAAALRRGSAIDRLVILFAVAGFTVPSFVVGLVLVLVFAVSLGLLPSGGQGSWVHGILPTITLGIGGVGLIARYARSAMLEVIAQPYIRAASAKGMRWRDVIWRHALPNAALPIVTVVGLMVGSLIAGAVVVESIFSWPGMGRLLVLSVAGRDLAVVQCILVMVTALMVVSNLSVDLLYGWLDPRVRASASA
jgi:peptide/nickel transport system permease protein